MAQYKQNKKKQNITSAKSKLASLLHKENKTLFIIEIVCIVAALVFGSFLVLYWVGNGFSTNDNILGINDGFYIRIDTPTPGSEFSQGNTIYIKGGSLGGALSQAIIWDTEYNVGAPCGVSATQFSYAIFPNHISFGKHTIGVQAQNVNGEWSQITYVEFEIKSGGLLTPPNYPTVPASTIPGLFQPLVDIWNGIIGHTEQGTGDNDLNGDNIDDRLQTSPFTPRYNPFNLPITLIIIVILIIIVAIVIAILLLRYLKQRGEYKMQMAKYIAASPKRRDWYLHLKAITDKKQSKSVIIGRLNFLRKREQTILQKQEDLGRKQTGVRPKPFFDFGTIGRSMQNRLVRLSEREQNIKKAHANKIRESNLIQQLEFVRHNMRVEQLENNKFVLQNQLLKIQRAKSLRGSNFNWFARRLAAIEAEQKQLKDQYRYQMQQEREKRNEERERFSSILTDLNKEKKQLANQKAVKILIVPKERPQPRIFFVPKRQVGIGNNMENRGMTYGRRKKK
jgi:hypothetical protein